MDDLVIVEVQHSLGNIRSGLQNCDVVQAAICLREWQIGGGHMCSSSHTTLFKPQSGEMTNRGRFIIGGPRQCSSHYLQGEIHHWGATGPRGHGGPQGHYLRSVSVQATIYLGDEQDTRLIILMLCYIHISIILFTQEVRQSR